LRSLSNLHPDLNLTHSTLEFQERIQNRTLQYTRHAQKSTITEKDGNSLLKVDADFKKIAVLADEKVELAKRIRFLILKARGRLQYDLQRIQNPPEPKGEESILVYSGSSRTPLQPVIESLKSTLAAPSPVAEVPAVVVAAPSPSPVPQAREGPRESKRMSPYVLGPNPLFTTAVHSTSNIILQVGS
jgi:hypothetical protein